jgi:iron complex outermembrane receptor protein
MPMRGYSLLAGSALLSRKSDFRLQTSGSFTLKDFQNRQTAQPSLPAAAVLTTFGAITNALLMKIKFTLRKTLLLSFLLCCSGILEAQETTTLPITLRVLNQKREPVAFASFTVINRLDSTQVFKQVADSSGKIILTLKKEGQYSVNITSVNYQPLEKGITIAGTQTVFSFGLEPLPKTLTGVVVTAQKPLVRQEDDKTIIDPEALVATSTSGYEVIEKTPGLFVDQDGNIYISSMTPAQIYINGREMKMSAADVATMLKSLPPNSIDKIEIMRTPSAKYDASGTGGIVNVVLKKGVKLGMTGSITAGMQQGNYGNQFAGFNLNNNDGKKNSFLNINIAHRDSYERILTDRLFAPDSMLAQNAYTKYPVNTYYLGYGIGYEFNKKWEVSGDLRASLNDFNNKTDNQSSISKISTSQLLTNNIARISNDGTSFNGNIGGTSKYRIDTLGSEWTSDISFSHGRNDAEQRYGTTFEFPAFPPTGGDGNNLNKRNHFTAQSDLKLKMKNKFTFETGVKTSILGFKSNADYFRETNGNRVKDVSRTNTFHYNENINAVYVQGSKTIASDIVIKFGTRLENTNMKGRQLVPGDTSFNIHRTDLFPYIYLSKNLMKIAGYDLRAYLVFRRTISRPVYEQLNPFPRYVDQYLTEIGNPSLKPQFTTNYEANISVDERPILAVGYNDTKDIFTNVIYQADSTRSQAYRTYDNLGKNREWYFRGLGALPPGKAYFFVLGAQYNYNMYDGLYEGKPLSFKKGTWTFFTYHSLKLDKRSQFTMHGFMRLRGQQGLYEIGSFGQLNASINRKFIKDKLTVTLSINDIFATNVIDFSIAQGSVSAMGRRQNDTRRVGINLRYNFGIRKKESNGNMFDVEPPSQ